MQITPVDNENNLFSVEHVFPKELATKVLNTAWPDLPWDRQEGQELWARRRIRDSAIEWLPQWDEHLSNTWYNISKHTGVTTGGYAGTAFWLDEPGFTCGIHTDGEMPGSLHMTWHGPGTTFYWHKDESTTRFQVPSTPNCGYIMINQPDSTGYRKLLWHAMLTPVPKNTFRLTTYSWINTI